MDKQYIVYTPISRWESKPSGPHNVTRRTKTTFTLDNGVTYMQSTGNERGGNGSCAEWNELVHPATIAAYKRRLHNRARFKAAKEKLATWMKNMDTGKLKKLEEFLDENQT